MEIIVKQDRKVIHKLNSINLTDANIVEFNEKLNDKNVDSYQLFFTKFVKLKDCHNPWDIDPDNIKKLIIVVSKKEN